MQARLQEKKDVNYKVSTEYFNYKHRVGQDKQRLEDQLALARVENEALKAQVDKIIEAEKADGEYSETLFQQKSAQFANRFRKTTRKNEEELNIVKVQYAGAQDQYLEELR